MIFAFTVPLQAAVAAWARILSEDEPLKVHKKTQAENDFPSD